MDDGGFLIATNVATESNPHMRRLRTQETLKLHITQFEPHLSDDLEKTNILRKNNCFLGGSGCLQSTYEVMK